VAAQELTPRHLVYLVRLIASSSQLTQSEPQLRIYQPLLNHEATVEEQCVRKREYHAICA
jgi:hypothetical protein